MTDIQLLEQTRQRVVRSTLNRSSSKQMWTFPKKKRFNKIKPQCPHASYQSQMSTLNPHYPKFSGTRRVVFQDKDHYPSPADYEPQTKTHKNLHTFGESRSKCALGSYILAQKLKNPAPTDYQKFAADDNHRSKKGFSMRPRTAHNYNQKQQVPSPLQYDTSLQKDGKFKIAKFRSINTTGGTGLMNKSHRFTISPRSPGPSSYQPKKVTLRNSLHCPMNKTTRSSWIDRINHKQASPGPGDYQLPSEFGHYLRPRSQRLMTIQ